MESSSQPIDIVLGYLEEPKNSFILTSKFLPSKVGGTPVSTLHFYTIGLDQ